MRRRRPWPKRQPQAPMPARQPRAVCPHADLRPSVGFGVVSSLSNLSVFLWLVFESRNRQTSRKQQQRCAHTVSSHVAETILRISCFYFFFFFFCCCCCFRDVLEHAFSEIARTRCACSRAAEATRNRLRRHLLKKEQARGPFSALHPWRRAGHVATHAKAQKEPRAQEERSRSRFSTSAAHFCAASRAAEKEQPLSCSPPEDNSRLAPQREKNAASGSLRKRRPAIHKNRKFTIRKIQSERTEPLLLAEKLRVSAVPMRFVRWFL